MNPFAQELLKERFRVYLDCSLLLALLVHMLGFLVAPPHRAAPYEPPPAPEPGLVYWEPPEIPLPPVKVKHPPPPPAPTFADIELSRDAAPDETIPDTDVDVESPVAGRIQSPEGLDRFRFSQFSDPPAQKRIYKPAYPRLARIAGVEATVLARVYIDEKGRVVRVEVLGSPPDIFVAPVVEALMKSEFYPARQRDIPVPCSVTVPFAFTLND